MTSSYFPGTKNQQVLFKFSTSSYNHFLQSQTFPMQVQFSGLENVCTYCPANRYPLNMMVTPETDPIPVNLTAPTPIDQPIAGVSDGLFSTRIHF